MGSAELILYPEVFFPLRHLGLNINDLYADPVSGTVRSLLPENILPNGDFSDWTLDNPDNWILSGTEDVNNYVTENPTGKAEILCEPGFELYQNNIFAEGVSYSYTFVVSAVSDTMIIGMSNGHTIYITSVGVYSGSLPLAVTLRLIFAPSMAVLV